MRLGEGRDEVVVVGGDGLKGGGCDPVRPAFLLEGADGAGGVLQDLDDAVEEDAVEADGLLVALDEGVHGGPPEGVWNHLDQTGIHFIWEFQGAMPLA